MNLVAELIEPVKKQKLAIAYFNVDELEIPPFQRDVSESLRKHLEIAIDKLGFLTPIVVVPKDGKYYVVDGMHRLEAVRSLGVKEIIAVIADESLYHHILEFNTEKPPTIRDKAKQAYRLYQDILSAEPETIEEDLFTYLKDPCLITLGFAIEEINSKFPAGFYDDFVGKIDQFLTLPLSEAVAERRKRAELIVQLNEVVTEKYGEFQWDNPLMKGDIVRKAIQRAYGVRVRSIEDDFYTAIERVMEACRALTPEDFN